MLAADSTALPIPQGNVPHPFPNNRRLNAQTGVSARQAQRDRYEEIRAGPTISQVDYRKVGVDKALEVRYIVPVAKKPKPRGDQLVVLDEGSQS
jgi:hypothetical protein